MRHVGNLLVPGFKCVFDHRKVRIVEELPTHDGRHFIVEDVESGERNTVADSQLFDLSTLGKDA